MPAPKKSRILIVDDHPAMREGLRAILHAAGDFVVCGEAETAQKGLAAVKKLRPDLAIVDISLRQKLDGLDLTRRLRKEWPALPVLAFSLHQEQAYTDAALASGALGYCTKSEPSEVLLKAVRRVLAGKSFVSKRRRR